MWRAESFCVEQRVRYSGVPSRRMDPGVDAELAILDGVPGAIGNAANSGTVLGENPIRANRTGQPILGPGTHTAAEWLNPGAFVAPPAYTFGDVGRNSVYGPPLQTMDIALVRAMRITEKLNLQVPAQAFSAPNHTNLGTPNRYVNEPQFGTITMAVTPGREIQLSARLSF